MFFRDYYFSSGNSRVNRLIALFRCIVGLMRQIYLSSSEPQEQVSCFINKAQTDKTLAQTARSHRIPERSQPGTNTVNIGTNSEISQNTWRDHNLVIILT